MSINLKQLCRKRDYYQEGPQWVRTIWKTSNAFDHFVKSRRSFLAHRGAIHKLGRDWFVDCEVFPCVADQAYLGELAGDFQQQDQAKQQC